MNKIKTYCFPALAHNFDDDQGMVDESPNRNRETIEEKKMTAEAQGFEQGFASGREEKMAEEQQRLMPVTNLLSKLTKNIDEYKTDMLKGAPLQVVELAVELAHIMLMNQNNKDTLQATKIFNNALRLAANQSKITIKANPEDHLLINSLVKQEFPSLESSKKIIITSDNSVNTGGCIIETDFGSIDARLDQQVQALSSELKGALNERQLTIRKSADVDRVFDHLYDIVHNSSPIISFGYVTQVVGMVVEANGPAVQLGSVCEIYGNDGASPVAAEVLGFRDRSVLMMPLEEIRSIGPGSKVVAKHQRASTYVGNQLLGRVIDGLGNPIDEKGPISASQSYPLYANPVNPLLRQRIQSPLDLGVRAINGLLTVGRGQRMGIFAGSGVGKSVLMGMIARKSDADVNVIALIGERGRELNDFIAKDLGAEGLKKSVVIVATSDHLPLVRVRGAYVAAAVADFFRDQGLTVNFMMDSLTRFAMAQREIGLALGEPPTTKGYTPSVFTQLPKLLERAGTSDHSGTITGLYTVLVEGDDMNDPIADAARSILDGHIVLSRDLAAQNHYPAIDVLRSISRVMEDIATLNHKHNAGRLKEMLATYRKAEDLINIGAYVAGSSNKIDRAIAKIDAINGFLRQGIQEEINLEQSLEQLESVINSD